jgi:hypothetical protein
VPVGAGAHQQPPGGIERSGEIWVHADADGNAARLPQVVTTLYPGIHGQGIYIDPKAEMVIARFASFPVATNRVINPTTLPAFDAMAAKLAR